MIWAIVNNEKTEAIPKTYGSCPLCEKNVFSKCGEINVWHWAHHKDESCDHWSEPESFWHKNWKMTFGKENAEVVITKGEKKHIADVLTKENVVIELQNSPIQKPVIRKRELFYGERMLWLINGIHFQQNFNIWESDDDYDPWLIHQPLTKEQKQLVYFNWKYARRSWEYAMRNVFIDFGENDLFWVKNGMGTSSGKGRSISKEFFIKKYGGNYEYYLESKNKS